MRADEAKIFWPSISFMLSPENSTGVEADTDFILIIGLAIGFLIGWLVFGEITQTGEARVAIGAIGNSTTGNQQQIQIQDIHK